MVNQLPNRHILAVITDLFFSVKIMDAAKKAGMTVELLHDPKQILEKAASNPAVIIVDLNLQSVDPIKLIAKLKGSAELKNIGVIGFLSHVQAELKQKATEAGCDMVLARSAFSQNLPAILKRHSGIV